MLDFTSALYLGLRHPSGSLQPWAQLTTGVPAALASPFGAAAVAQKLAAMQGCEQATLAPSTLHLFWDLFGMVPSDTVAIYMDADVYPLARWGIERAAWRGVPVRSFPHHDVEALRRLLKRDAPRRARPVVVTDGYCPDCSQPAPLIDYLESTRSFGGSVVIDDTQAIGIFGYAPGCESPYGSGGGGMMRWNNVTDPNVLVISSLAKGFGVPIAVLSGSQAAIRCFEEKSETRVHCSPPSVAVVNAALHALALNHKHGDALRGRLAQLIRRFRKRLQEIGLSATGGFFPVQTLADASGTDAQKLYERLLRSGIKTVLRRGRCGYGARLSFLITALHHPHDIDCAVNMIASIV